MSENWHSVWQQKKVKPGGRSALSQLIAADGYDAFGGFDESTWMQYTERVGTKMGVKPESSLYEIGCGAGAFLYPFYSRGHRVGGCDFSRNLVNAAKEAMPEGDFYVADALHFDTEEKYDAVLSNGVFLYFPDYDYAAAVLAGMINKAVTKISVLEVPDLAKREHALQYRRGHMGEEEYKRRYEGLDHLYYPKEWFSKTLGSLDVEIKIEDQHIPGYLQSSYRYNVFITRRTDR